MNSAWKLSLLCWRMPLTYRKNILGAFTHISANAFPARHPSMMLVLNMDASVAEAAQTKQLRITLVGEDGQIIGEITGETTLPPTSAAQGPTFHIGLIVPLKDIVFPQAGNYSFDVQIDNRTEQRVPLSLLQL